MTPVLPHQDPDDVIDTIRDTKDGWFVTFCSGRKAGPYVDYDEVFEAYRYNRCGKGNQS